MADARPWYEPQLVPTQSTVVVNPTTGVATTVTTPVVTVNNFPATQPVSGTVSASVTNTPNVVDSAAEASLATIATNTIPVPPTTTFAAIGTQAPEFAHQIGGVDEAGDFHPLATDGFGNLKVTSVDLPQPAATVVVNPNITGPVITIPSLPPNAAQETFGNLALIRQTLSAILVEARRHTFLLQSILSATGNDTPGLDTIDGVSDTWQQ